MLFIAMLLSSVEPHVSSYEMAQLIAPAMNDALTKRLSKLSAACSEGDDGEACRIEAAMTALLAPDKEAQKIAVDLYRKTGTVTGVLAPQIMDGSYRGKLSLVPRLPTGAHRRHLKDVANALIDLDAFFTELMKRGEATVAFRHRPLGLRFFESVKRKTPSAFAEGWTVSHNVNGSLFWSPRATADTYVHEIFHLNDEVRGWWSKRALQNVYDRIVAICGVDVAKLGANAATYNGCLKPYAPDGIVVKGGVYYAFMPQNGVIEYAADVGKRYVVEHRALLEGKAPATPFRCQSKENDEAWRLVVDEFFGGIDLLPPCAQKPKD